MSDVVVVGGGVIGLTIAWELAIEGLSVSVLDQSEIGLEASWAGAGMIPPGDLHHEATHQLAALSSQRWPVLTAALRSETGIDNGYRRCGAILIDAAGDNEVLASRWRERHLRADVLDATQLQQLNNVIGPAVTSGIWVPDLAQVRNPWHLRALRTACELHGVRFYPNQKVHEWTVEGGRLTAVNTSNSAFAADQFVVAAGAWTPQILPPIPRSFDISPVHGQIVLLRANEKFFDFVVERGTEYLVPRNDGRILVGATEEYIGFEKRNTDDAIQKLRSFANSMIPALADLPVEKYWSGLRPRSDRGCPFIGGVPEHDNLFIAAGHFRAGLSNSPATALVVKQLVLGEPPTIDLTEFSC
ncbi:glycine oxidase ThiO [Planctomicrobium sp. SH668]|uniref:glycine oxidase ThiO n=1 Tax=Planctomicrobium sp. SH668 TaxID=3448126 RepID=UPI003F5BD83B